MKEIKSIAKNVKNTNRKIDAITSNGNETNNFQYDGLNFSLPQPFNVNELPENNDYNSDKRIKGSPLKNIIIDSGLIRSFSNNKIHPEWMNQALIFLTFDENENIKKKFVF